MRHDRGQTLSRARGADAVEDHRRIFLLVEFSKLPRGHLTKLRALRYATSLQVQRTWRVM